MSLAIDNNVSIRILNKFTCILYFSMAIGCNKVIINTTSGSLFPDISFYTCVCDLSVMVDFELTFSYHINLVAQKCYYQLRQLWVVSHSLTHQSTLTLVYAFVTSRIDCCSSLLVGLPLGTLARLDRVLRSAAYLVERLPNFSVSRQLVYGHFVYDTSSTDISSTDISSTMTFVAEIEAGVMKRKLCQ